MRFSKYSLLCISFVSAFGCQSGADVARLEAETRSLSAELNRLQTKLDSSQRLLQEQDAEIVRLRSDSSPITLVSGSEVPSNLEENAAWSRVVGVDIHRLTSAITLDEHDVAHAHLVIQPVDRDGEPVKIAGRLKVSLQDAGNQMQKTWQKSLTLTECRQAWRSGLVSAGFYVSIPLGDMTDLPATLKVDAEFDLGNGSRFETTEELSR